MSDSENTNMESTTLPGWTLVSNQGEIMSGDEDSESSESSIEVVSLENNAVVSHRLQRGSNSEQDEVVVTEDEPSTDSASVVANSSLEKIVDVTELTYSSDDSTQKTIESKEAVLDSEIIHETNADHVQIDVTLSGNFSSQGTTSSSTDDVFQEQEANLLEGGISLQYTTDLQPDCACENPAVPEQPLLEDGEQGADDLVLQIDTTENLEPDNIDSTANSHQIAGDLELDESHREVTDEASSGACCMELLLEGVGAQQTNSSATTGDKDEQFPIPASVSCEKVNISQLACESATENSHASRSDSDADSDYVRLDSDNIDAYVEEQQNNNERVIIPLKLYRTGSSIGPSFSFMRSDERNDQVPQNQEPFDVVDQDRDDDTESTTEEGIDDRIESEQSEAGSLSTQYDVGDLSVFTDIGDLPLVAGDVPRNYIHRPNNHLSTVLNIIVVLVAILTMGISLGIIMATDLEIEEWQNAHAFQTRRVSQLDILLKSKTNAYELQFSRVKELEPQLTEIRNTLRTLEKRAKNYERAFDVLATYSSVEGKAFEQVLHTVLDGIKDYVLCQEESNQLVPVDCHLKLLPYIKSYTALIKNDLSVDTTFNMDHDVLSAKNSDNNEDVGIFSQDITADSLSLLFSKSNDKDSHVSDKNEVSHGLIETYNANTETNSENLDLQMENNGGFHSLEKSNTLLPSSEHDIRSKDKTSGSTSEQPDYRPMKAKAKETIQASPVPLDVRQLQQSLTREQERALHWQQLYLSERRQRERERENEEWEDEREREMAQREKEQIDHVECLRKLMSANLTTLTQHVVKWNVSVFDDFANLSVLLSGISDLQQAVVDSVQKVWKSAEEVIDSLHSKDSKGEDETWGNTIPKKEMIIEYLGLLANRVKRVDLLDNEVFVEYLSGMLEHVKHGVEDILGEVYTESMTNSVYKMWENAEEIIAGYHNHKETTVDGEKVGSTLPDREYLLSYLSKVLNDICHKDSTEFEAHTIKQDNKDDHDQSPEVVHEDKTSEYRDFSDTSSTGPNLETLLHDSFLDEEEPSKHGFWSRRIGKMLKKTGKTVRKLGRKVAGTWGKIKSMWHEKKPLWHKIKNMWHEKKSAVFNTGGRFASTVMKVPSKFARMCTKLSKNWLKTSETTEVDIHIKCMHKLRKHWQKMVLKNPCQIVGKFSYECNSGRKQCKRDMHTISNSFSNLMKIPNFKREQILKLNVNDLKRYQKQFKSFQDLWGKSNLLLTTDIRWVNCQLAWWSAAVSFSSHGNVDKLENNKCNIINLADNFYEGHRGMTFGPDVSCVAENTEKDVDYVDDEHIASDGVHSHHSTSSSVKDYDDDEEEEKESDLKSVADHELSILKSDETKTNETTLNDNYSFDWYQEQSRYRNHLRKEQQKTSWVFDRAASRKQERNKQRINSKDDDNEINHNNWMFEKAKYKEQKREESGESFLRSERTGNKKIIFEKKG